MKLDSGPELWQHCFHLGGVIMAGKLLITGVCVVILALPALSFGASSEMKDSSYWSNLVHEENSVVASVLLLPYLVIQIPYRLVDGIISPKSASMSTTPPPAHRISH